jgi:hypothetical protein
MSILDLFVLDFAFYQKTPIFVVKFRNQYNMLNPVYDIEVTEDRTQFEFISEGNNGKFTKVVVIAETNYHNLYNLSLTDYDATTNSFDDLSVSNNGDTLKILATVAQCIVYFLEQYPNARIYATGSTLSRNRLYRMGISSNYDLIEKEYIVLGQTNQSWVFFSKNTNYDAFLITKK